jgi:hypothetical protein
MALAHPDDHPDDPATSPETIWTDETINVSKPDPSDAVQFDAEYPARKWKPLLIW